MLLSVTAYLLLVFGTVAYLLYCVKPANNTAFGRFRAFMLYQLPGLLSHTGNRIFGPRFTTTLISLKNYVFFSNNSLVMFFYLIIAPGSFGLYVYEVMIRYYGYFSRVHLLFGNALVAFAFYMYYKTYSTNPGVITPTNADTYRQRYAAYEDGYVFPAGPICDTCKTVK